MPQEQMTQEKIKGDTVSRGTPLEKFPDRKKVIPDTYTNSRPIPLEAPTTSQIIA
jgi:hypothetical protein